MNGRRWAEEGTRMCGWWWRTRSRHIRRAPPCRDHRPRGPRRPSLLSCRAVQHAQTVDGVSCGGARVRVGSVVWAPWCRDSDWRLACASASPCPCLSHVSSMSLVNEKKQMDFEKDLVNERQRTGCVRSERTDGRSNGPPFAQAAVRHLWLSKAESAQRNLPATCCNTSRLSKRGAPRENADRLP